MSQTPDVDESTTRTRTYRYGFVVLLVTVALIVPICAWLLTREGHQERFQREVREGIPVGSSTEDAIAWADAHEATVEVNSWDTTRFPGNTFLPEVAGVPREDLRSFIEISIPLGKRLINGQYCNDRLWVYLPLNENDEVKGHYFLTLSQLAEFERQQREQSKR